MGFKSGLVLALVAMTAGFFTKLARLGVMIPVLQWRIDWFKRQLRRSNPCSPGVYCSGAIQ